MLLKTRLFILTTIVFTILFFQLSCDKDNRTGRNALSSIDTIAFETEKLDRLVLTRDTVLIQNQIIKLYELLERRVKIEDREKRLKMIKPRFKKLLKELKPIVDRLKRNKYN